MCARVCARLREREECHAPCTVMHMRLAIACGSSSHAAQVRTQLALSCSSRSHAARRRAPAPKLVHGLVMTRCCGGKENSLAFSLRPRSASGIARDLSTVCVSLQTSVPRAKRAARALAIQRWQSQAGRAGARQASVQQAARPRADAHRVHEMLANEKRDGPSDHRRGRSRA